MVSVEATRGALEAVAAEGHSRVARVSRIASQLSGSATMRSRMRRKLDESGARYHPNQHASGDKCR